MNRLCNRLDVARLRPGPVPRGLSLLQPGRLPGPGPPVCAPRPLPLRRRFAGQQPPPRSGGLSPQAQACLRATRQTESKVKFWDLAPRLDLLSDRDADEAYLGADPGKAYLLYFTKNGGGSVGLDLAAYPGATFEIAWVNIDTGEWGSRGSLSGGASPTVARPDGTAHWVAVIVR